ncbi:MAG: SUF system NifU family Fe-S cluster assembly protein [Bacteroidia bacterium]|nr:SUF system NifU family Fe-S cluster assembly protein [Bacteroidia bacterium]MDW8235249.1 SUF system NifU family Fe-S cluster assembly protein [Bacteroidia bacterium]
MNTQLKQLYQEIILDHNRYPRNYGRLENPTHQARGHNPLCGDQIELTLQIRDNVIEDIRFEGKSCSICKASASVMTTVVKGTSLEEAETLFEAFHELLTHEEPTKVSSLAAEWRDKLSVFSTVRLFPVRVKCATLPWHTLHNALKNSTQVASTE